MIKFENVSFKYKGQDEYALKDINFEINKGEVILLCGLSGSGKSTTSRIINGLIPNFYKGELNGKIAIRHLSQENNINDFVGYVGSVFQNPKTQFFNVDVRSELAFAAENMGLEPNVINNKIKEIVNKYHFDDLIDKSVFEISGGQKQLIALACCDMLDNQIIVLDEPTANLDAKTTKRLLDILIAKKQEGKTIIICEHRLAWCKELIDRYFVFNNSELIKTYSSSEISALAYKEISNLGLRNINENFNFIENNAADAKPNLRIENLKIGYHSKLVNSLNELNFYNGKIACILGDNGVGKTTLIRTLCGLQKELTGTIYYNNKKLNRKERIRKSFLVMQDVNYQLFSESVTNELLLNNDDIEKTRYLLKKLNLYHKKEQHPMTLSGGEKQRLAIITALLSAKEIIVFDEPTAGQDLFHLNLFIETLNYLKQENKIIIIVTHDLQLASQCDYRYYLNELIEG